MLITVVSVTGINAEAHWRAIKRTQEALPFDTRARLIYKSGMDLEQYSRYMVKELHHDIETDFALVCQADGWGLRSHLWRADFFDFDFCGAPFPNGDIGNGGLSLRSRKFLCESARLDPPDLAEDAYLCQYRRGVLEAAGIQFAPLSVAQQFSFEHPVEGHPWDKTMSWGVHGSWNL